jgi:O-antigen ligase
MNHALFIKLLGSLFLLIPLLAPFTKGTVIAPHEFKFYISSVIILLLFSLWLFNKGFDRYFKIIKSSLFLPMTLFLLWASFSSFWAINSHLSLMQLQQWFFALLVFILVLNAITTKDIFKILSFIFFASVIVSIVGILQYLFDFDLIRQAVKPASFFGNKNMAIHFIVLTLPLGLGLLLHTKDKTKKILLSFGLSFVISYLMFSRTRSGWLAFVVQILFVLLFLVFIRKQKIIKFKFFPMVVFILMIGFITFNLKINFQNTAISIAKEMSLSNTGNSRINSWLNTLEMIKDNPLLGVGLGNWNIHYSKYHDAIVKGRLFNEKSQLNNVHNDYLTIFSELGLIGFSLLLWLFYLIVFKLWQLLKTQRSPHPQQFLILGMATSLVGFLVNANFTFPLSMYLPVVIIMVYFAMIERLFLDIDVMNKKQKESIFYQFPKKINVLLGFAFLTLSVVMFLESRAKIQAEDLYFEAERLERKGQWQQLEKIAFKSYQLNPNRQRIASYLAEAKQHLGKLEEAEKYFEQGLALNPYNINTLSFFATAMVASKKYQKAQSLYQKALNIYPTWAKGHKNFGVLLFKFLNKPIEAKNHFKKALKLNPNIHQAALLKQIVNQK